jgi:hypothetical protein
MRYTLKSISNGPVSRMPPSALSSEYTWEDAELLLQDAAIFSRIHILA